MTAVRNKHHSVSMSSVEVESSLNLDAMVSANAVRASLSAIWFDKFFVVEKSFVRYISMSKQLKIGVTAL